MITLNKKLLLGITAVLALASATLILSSSDSFLSYAEPFAKSDKNINLDKILKSKDNKPILKDTEDIKDKVKEKCECENPQKPNKNKLPIPVPEVPLKHPSIPCGEEDTKDKPPKSPFKFW